MRVHEAAFRLLLGLYPRRFRREYGDEMTSLFRVRLARARKAGRMAVARLWLGLVGDAVTNALAVRRGARLPRTNAAPPVRRSPLPERREDRMETLWQDIRHAGRRLAQSPGFTLGAVALLAVGIGVNAAVFTVADTALLRPPVWSDPDRVVAVYQDSDDGDPSSSSYPATRDMAASPVFSGVAAISQTTLTWDGADGPTDVSGEYVTASYLDVLGLPVLRGRWFGPEDDVPGAAPKAVVSEGTWRSRLGADPDVVGRTIRIEGQPVTIIGVGPADLVGTYAPLRTDFWFSIASTALEGPYRVENLERREDHWYDVRARLAEGVTVAQSQSAMDNLATRLAEEYPALNRGRDITVFPSDDVRFHPGADGGLRLAGGLLAALAGVVLLLTCANLANLLLVRGLGRSGEMAVRRALGARQGRVARLFMIESLLLSAAGGGLGVLLAMWAVALLPSLPIPMPVVGGIELAVDGRVIAFSLALTAATGLLFGLAPALRSARTDVARVLRDDRASVAGGRATLRLRNVLVGVQVAASLVLVLGTGLLARSLAAMQAADTGVDADRVAWVRADFGQSGLDGDALRQAQEQLLDRIRAMPGVTAAGVTSRLPATGGGTTTTVVEGYTPPAGTDAVEMPYAVVGDGYFEALGIPLRAGRLFDDADADPANATILVNEAAARRYWPDQDPIGKRNRSQTGETWRRVVGVVGDAPVAGLTDLDQPIMYFPARRNPMAAPVIVARTDGRPDALLPALRQAVEESPYTVTIASQGTLASVFGSVLEAPRIGAALMGAFSLLALVLAGLGVYAIVAFSVARRSAELGIRMALGARGGNVVGMVVREVVATVAVGLIAGLALALAGATALEGLLFGISPRDPVTIALAVAFILAVSAAAAWVPARRAARTDPVSALRAS